MSTSKDQAGQPPFNPSYGTCDQVSDLCPVSLTLYGSRFNLGGNIFFLVIFCLLTAVHVAQGIRYRRGTYAFAIWVSIGTLLETLGYIARAVMHFNPWSIQLLSLQLCTLLWGPTCIAAGTSVVFKHVVIYCGAEHSIIRPALIPWLFVGTDVVSLFIQGIGGIVASVGTGGSGGQSLLDIGSKMVITGVVFQVVNMALCSSVVLAYFWRYRRAVISQRQRQAHSTVVVVAAAAATTSSNSDSEPATAPLPPKTQLAQDQETKPHHIRNFKIFIYAMIVAFTAIFARCVYRVPEMANGWANDIMRDETTFLIFDGTMVSIAALTIAIFHPARYFPYITERVVLARTFHRVKVDSSGESGDLSESEKDLAAAAAATAQST